VSRPLLLSCPCLLLAACSQSRPAGEVPEKPQVVMHGAKLRSYEGSTLTLTGHAERATYQRSSGELVAHRATVHVLSEDPAQPSTVRFTIRAPLMESTLGSRRLVASGGVELRGADGLVANTPRATYDAAEASVRGYEGVRADGPGYQLQADTFSLSLPEESFTFEGAVQTVLGAARD
jgi:lipopolysaccharide export system protein LptC